MFFKKMIVLTQYSTGKWQHCFWRKIYIALFHTLQRWGVNRAHTIAYTNLVDLHRISLKCLKIANRAAVFVLSNIWSSRTIWPWKRRHI